MVPFRRSSVIGLFVAIVVVGALLVGARPSFAAPAESGSLPTQGASAVTLQIPEAARGGPAFDPKVATQAYVELLSPEERSRSAAYANGGYWVSLVAFLYGLGVAWLLLGTGLSRWMRDRAEKITRWRNIHALVYGWQYILVTTALTMPLTVYTDFIREHRFGLATQSFPEWMTDQLKGLSVGLILGGFALMVVYAVVRRFPRRWWVGASVTAIGFVVLTLTVSPVLVAPLFNDYRPLPAGPLRDDILSMARANGVPASDVYWFDASKQTTRISANVSGLLGTTRISLNDNLLHKTSDEEIKAVMAHEIGHYVLNHGWESIIALGLVIVVGLVFVQWGFGVVWRRFGAGWGVLDVTDPAGLPLAVALLSVYFAVATPVVYGIIRTNEIEADIFGLNAAQQPDGFARVAIRLSTYRKIDPHPWEEALLYHHPSGMTRVRTAMQWKQERMNLEKRSGPR